MPATNSSSTTVRIYASLLSAHSGVIGTNKLNQNANSQPLHSHTLPPLEDIYLFSLDPTLTDPTGHTTTPAGGPLPTTSSFGYVPVTLEDNSSNPLQFNNDKGTGIFNANRSDMDSLSVHTQGLSLLRANSVANAATSAAVPSGHPPSTSSGGQLLFMDPSLTSSALSKALVSNSGNSVIGGTFQSNSTSSHYQPTVPEADRGTVNQSSVSTAGMRSGDGYLPRQFHQEMDRESKDKNGNTGNQLETFAPSSSSAPTFKDSYYSSKLLGEAPAGDLHGSTEKYVPGKSNDNVNDIIMPSSYRFVSLSEQKPHSQQMPMVADDGTVARARILADDDKYNKDQGDRDGARNNQSATSTTNFQRPELENYTQQQLKLKSEGGKITPPMNYYLRNTDHYFDDYVAQDVTRSVGVGGGGNRWKVAEDGNKDKDIPVGSSSSPSSSFSVTAVTNSSHPQPQQVHQKWEKVVEVDDEDEDRRAGQAVGNHSQGVTGNVSTFLSKPTPDHFIDTLGGNKWSSLSSAPIIHQDKPPASASTVATSDKEWDTNSKQQTNYYDMSAEEKKRNPHGDTGDELTGKWDTKKDDDEVHGLYDKDADDHHQQRQEQDSYYQQPMGNQNTTVGGNNKSLHKLQFVPEEALYDHNPRQYEDNYEKTDVGSEKPYKYEQEELDQGEFNYPQNINQNNYPDRIEGGPGLVSGAAEEHNMSSFTNGQLRYSPQQQLPSGAAVGGAGGQYGSPNKSFAYERRTGPHQQKEDAQEEEQQENANIYSSPQKERVQSPVDAAQVPPPPPEGGNSNQGSPRKRMTQLRAQQLEEKPLEMDQSYYAQGDRGTQQLQQQPLHSYQEELPDEYLGNSSTATPSTLVNHPSHPAVATTSDPAYPEADAHDALALNQQQHHQPGDEYSTSPKGDLMHPVGTYQSQSHYEPGNNNTGVVDDYGGNYEESGYVVGDHHTGHQGAMDYSNYLADATPVDGGGQGDEAYLSNYTNEQEYTGGAAVDGSDYGNHHQTGDVLQSTSYGDEMGHGGDYQEYYSNNQEQQSYATPGQEGNEGRGQVEGVNYDGNYSTAAGDEDANGAQGYYTDQQSQEAHQGEYYEEPAYQQNQLQQEESQQQERFPSEYYSEPIDYNNHQSAPEQQPPPPAVTGATVSFAPEPEVGPEKPKKPIKKVQILESSDSEQTQRQQQQTKRGPTGGVLKGGLLKNKKATPTSSDSSDFNFSSK